MSGAVERSDRTRPAKDLAQGAGKTVPLKPKENFEGRPHPEAREARNLRKHLRSLTMQVMAIVARMDRIMKQPESNLRGKQIAEAMNALEMSNDSARYFGLDIDFRADKKHRNKETTGVALEISSTKCPRQG
jgi:hypothetical protein